MDLSKMLRTVLMMSAVLLWMTQGASALDIGYQSTRSMRGVRIPPISLLITAVPITQETATIAAKIRLSDGQNWVTIQVGRYGPAASPLWAELRILSKQVGGLTQTRVLGHVTSRDDCPVQLIDVQERPTGVTLTLLWCPDTWPLVQETVEHIALPWAGTETLFVGAGVPTRIVRWEQQHRLAATAVWRSLVGWQRVAPDTATGIYWFVCDVATETWCWIGGES